MERVWKWKYHYTPQPPEGGERQQTTIEIYIAGVLGNRFRNELKTIGNSIQILLK